jgi:hypothetical protein
VTSNTLRRWLGESRVAKCDSCFGVATGETSCGPHSAGPGKFRAQPLLLVYSRSGRLSTKNRAWFVEDHSVLEVEQLGKPWRSPSTEENSGRVQSIPENQTNAFFGELYQSRLRERAKSRLLKSETGLMMHSVQVARSRRILRASGGST